MRLAALLLLALAGAPQPTTFADLTREARGAYDKGDYATFLEQREVVVLKIPLRSRQ